MKALKVAFLAFGFGEYCVRLVSGIAQDHHTSICAFLPGDEVQSYIHLLSKSVHLELFDKPRLRQPSSQVLKPLVPVLCAWMAFIYARVLRIELRNDEPIASSGQSLKSCLFEADREWPHANIGDSSR